MERGTIKHLTNKGFGFIQAEAGGDVFFHHTALLGGIFIDELWEGQKVRFEAIEAEKGLKAESVEVL